MKHITIANFTRYPSESSVEALERAYLQYKSYPGNPPDAIAFCEEDYGNQLFRWEDVEILHFLPSFEAKRSYYWILIARDRLLNKKNFPTDVAEVISHYLPSPK